MELWAKLQLGQSSRKAAETLTRKLSNFDGLASIMMEVARDRFVGYPNGIGYADDSAVPFRNPISGVSGYPIRSEPLPLDWQLVSNVDTSSQEEHLQDRATWYKKSTADANDKVEVSTASATFRMQGSCDPSVTNPAHEAYFLNCTDENNHVASGGKLQPTPTAASIAAKAADLNFVLKPLFEFHKETRVLGYYFANSGAGSVVSYPHVMSNGTSSFTSTGCEWMMESNPINPSRTIASPQEIQRCHPEGVRVNGREYNPLERGWCREQALNPHKTQNVGPYLDAFKKGLWLMTFGRAVYDRSTGEFIACTLADVGVDQISKIIEDVEIARTSKIALVRWNEEGTVVASPRWDSSFATSTTTVMDPSLGLGVDREIFEKMKIIVDFTRLWDPAQAREAFEGGWFVNEGKLITGFPVPVPPDLYDGSYRPEYLVVRSIDLEDLFQAATNMDDDASESIDFLIRDTLIVGFVGMSVIVFVIYIVGLYLTRPLQGINRMGDKILDTYGDDLQAIDFTRAKTLWCSPRTEISDLAREFHRMVSTFSGTGSAKIVRQKLTEVKNPFALFEPFRDLYESRRDNFFPYGYNDSFDRKNDESHLGNLNFSSKQGLHTMNRNHMGPNIKEHKVETPSDAMSQFSIKERKNVLHSPLFRWIVASIMTPLLLTMIVISALVTFKIRDLESTLIKIVEDQFVELETKALFASVILRARFAGEVMDQAIRDLHVLTRVATWLLFGGIQRSAMFSHLMTGAEQCKIYPADGSCPLITNRFTSPCDCNWKDDWGLSCVNYDNDTRYLQHSFFEGLSQDIWPNGDRNYTSFPLVATLPELTEWWDKVERVPGAEKGTRGASGYATTFDRLSTISSLSVIQIPLYNYGASGQSKRPLATYIAFEADGIFTGYAGCKHTHAQYSHWKSTASNGAPGLRPELCPEGKLGYDPRCRGWYDSGKKIADDGRNPLHVTSPYPFASGITGQSSTLPLVDPQLGTHVGQALVDFLPQDIIDSLLPENTPLADGAFPILITAQPDGSGADTVVGPGYNIDSEEQYPIGDLVLPYDCSDIADPKCINRLKFEEILDDMRSGKENSSNFMRTDPSGLQENVFFAYAPVTSHAFDPKDSSDFSRGVDAYEPLVFSLAVAVPELGFLRPFREKLNGHVQFIVSIGLAVHLALIVIAGTVVTLLSSKITFSITVPITRLLSLVQKINKSDIKDDLPDLHGGSREVSQVYGTFDRLYKVVRFANSAFFTGDLDKAYSVLNEALSVFSQLNNKKAIAIANNNLGITMLTMYRTMQSLGESSIWGLTVEDVIIRGTIYFNQAIALGEEALELINEEEGWSKNYLVFMQQLSNRYFNRAMFFLTVRKDHHQPDDAERQGIKDLTVTRELDTEVAENGGDSIFSDNEGAHFNLVLNRIRGLLILMDMSYPDDWGIEELFEDAIQELSEVMADPHHAIFRDVAPAGMMQQLDADMIDFTEVDRDGTIMAARIGIRMLVEDEYVLPYAARNATKNLLRYLDIVEEAGIPGVASSETRRALEQYLEILSPEMQYPEKEDTVRHISMRQSMRGDVTMEFF